MYCLLHTLYQNYYFDIIIESLHPMIQYTKIIIYRPTDFFMYSLQLSSIKGVGTVGLSNIIMVSIHMTMSIVYIRGSSGMPPTFPNFSRNIR